jgi:hypothetical protein
MSGFQHDEHPFPGLDMGEQIDAFRPSTAYEKADELHEAALMGEVGLTDAEFNEVRYLRTYRAVAPLYGPAGALRPGSRPFSSERSWGAASMADLSPTAPKLPLMIPRLANDQPGEVVAAVEAIERKLAGADLDLHDLAAHVGTRRARSHGTPPQADRWQPADDDDLDNLKRHYQSGAYRPLGANPDAHFRGAAERYEQRRRQRARDWSDPTPKPSNPDGLPWVTVCDQMLYALRGSLNAKGTAFVLPMRANTATRHPPPKQAEWLVRLHDRARRMGADGAT